MDKETLTTKPRPQDIRKRQRNENGENFH